jgi:hypothetical protein
MLPVLYVAAAFAWSGQPDWTWSTFPALGFKILAPCEMVDHATEVPTDAEVISYHQITCGSLDDEQLPMTFIVDHYQLPGDLTVMTKEELDAFFDNTIAPIMEAVGGSVIYADVTAAGGKDICSWKATYREGACLIRGESMIINGQYYGLQAFGWTDHKPEAHMNKFFDSFRPLSHEEASLLSPSRTKSTK